MLNEKQLCSSSDVSNFINKIADSILKSFPSGTYSLVGIHHQGVPLAEKICDRIAELTNQRPECGKLDISMYRDDIGNRDRLPLIKETIIPFDVNNQNIILVDDVLSTGRTIRAALDALTDYGRPGLIRLAVLVDRGEPEFPIRADFVGTQIQLPQDYKILVNFDEDDNKTGIFAAQWNTPRTK